MKASEGDNTAATPINRALTPNYDKSITLDTFIQQPSLRTKTYSFQDLPQQSLNLFCKKVNQIHALANSGKRLTDANVLMLNSTQKEMVEMIITNNKHSLDQKSKFLTQRAGKYIKLLWKTEKFNDPFPQNPTKIQKTEPHYASPIHNFKKAKASFKKDQLSPLTERIQKSTNKTKPLLNEGEVGKSSHSRRDSRSKRNYSQDHKFSNVRLGKLEGKRQPKEKSFEIDLTKNIAWRTINTTKNFENMLKILKQEQQQ